MKKINRNWLKANFERVQALNYGFLCKYGKAMDDVAHGYNYGKYGWNYDVMEDAIRHPTVAITAGYRPYGNNYLTPSDLRELHDCYGKISNWDWIDMLFSKIENA